MTLTSRVDEVESSMNSLKENFQSEIGTLKKMLEQVLKQQMEAQASVMNASGSGGMENSNGRHIGNKGPPEANWFSSMRGRKLELPIFDGKDPDDWIIRAERYFSLNRLSKEEQIEVSIISFEGDALRWFQWEHRRRPIREWEELKLMMLKQFRSNSNGSLCEQFLALRQESSIEEYKRRFVSLAVPLVGISNELYLSQFINGLDPIIKAEVRLLSPITLNDAMELAVKIEEKNRVLNKHRNSGAWNNNKSNNPSMEGRLSSIQTPKTSISSEKAVGEFRRLSDAELQSRRAQGLCYRCDEKFSPGHKCKKKELSVLVTQVNEEEEDVGDNESEEEPETEEIPEEVQGKVQVHLNSVIGITNPRTMKLEGKIENQRVVILIDSGATHNFISLETLEQLKIPTDKTGKYPITMGTGLEVTGQGVCRNVKVQTQGIVVEDSFLPLRLGNSDLIFGMQWLVKLGGTNTNWAKQIMKFKLGDKWVTLRGDPTLEKSMVSLKSITKSIIKEGHGVIVEFGGMLIDQGGTDDRGQNRNSKKC